MLDETTNSLAQAARLGAALVLGGSLGVPAAVALGRRFLPAGEASSPRWGILQLIGVFLVALATSFALALLAPLLGVTETGPLGKLLQTLAMFLVTGALIGVYATLPGPGGLAALGLTPRGNARAIGVSGLVYLLLLPLLLGFAYLWPWGIQRLGGEPESQAVLVGFLELRGGELAAAIVLGTLVLPFFEELIFRGFVQPVLVRYLRPAGGVVLTSALFALLHGVDAFLPVFALSLVLGAVMLRTGRLSAAWAVHGLHNGLMLAAVLLVPAARELVEDVGLSSWLFSSLLS